MSRILAPFFIALQFLTRVPVPESIEYSGEAQAQSLLYYPLVGLLIGLLLVALPLPAAGGMLNAVILVTVWALVTGGLHLDGLADTVDAWIGGQGDPERTLSIMKDPASGPMGVAAICLVLFLKVAAVYELGNQSVLWLLLIPPLLGRTAVLVFVVSTAYIRPGGLGEVMARRLQHRPALIVIGMVVFGIGMAGGVAGIGLLTLLAVLCMAVRHALVWRIGGITGDTLGAVLEVFETATLILLVWLPKG